MAKKKYKYNEFVHVDNKKKLDLFDDIEYCRKKVIEFKKVRKQ